MEKTEKAYETCNLLDRLYRINIAYRWKLCSSGLRRKLSLIKAFKGFFLAFALLLSGCTSSSEQDSYSEPAKPVEAENEVTYILESFNDGYPKEFSNQLEEGNSGYTAIVTIENLSDEDLDYSILDFRLSDKQDEKGVSPDDLGTDDEFPRQGILESGKNYTGVLYFQLKDAEPLYLRVYENRQEASENEDPLVTWIVDDGDF